MLLTLHSSLAWGIDGWPARAMLLAHCGLFLVWQPLWCGERSLEPRHIGWIAAAALMFMVWNTWWVMATWIAVLFALIGGSLLGSAPRSQRLVALLAALYLLTLLLVWVVPHLFADLALASTFVWFVQYGLVWLPLVIIAVPAVGGRRCPPVVVDLYYSMMLFLLVAGLVLGSFVVKQLSQGDYPLALAQSLMVMAVVLLSLSWLWNPHSGFIGIGQLWSRYLMTLGLPFERWLHELADVAEREPQPAQFMALAMQSLCELPWVSGVAWDAPHASGELGARTRFTTQCTASDVHLTFHTRWSLSPALYLHLKLLTQMLAHFYDAKRREQAQRDNAYAQAIYETGARLTHDVKNLLQSLAALCAAAEDSNAEESVEFQALIKRQLPAIAQRLSLTLEKLRTPHQARTTQVDALAWWEALKQRYAVGCVSFLDAGVTAGVPLPGELFDSVAENLLQNAIAKAQQHPGVSIEVALACARGGRLTVCDTGPALPAAIASGLFSAPVPSATGLGVGLLQAGRHAQRLGYRLALNSNVDGRVCFELARAAV